MEPTEKKPAPQSPAHPHRVSFGSFKKSASVFSQHNPHRDWLGIVCFFVAVIALIVTWQMSFFDQIEQGVAFSVEKTATRTPTGIQRSELDTLVKRFDDRAKIFDGLKSDAPSSVDPAR